MTEVAVHFGEVRIDCLEITEGALQKADLVEFEQVLREMLHELLQTIHYSTRQSNCPNGDSRRICVFNEIYLILFGIFHCNSYFMLLKL